MAVILSDLDQCVVLVLVGKQCADLFPCHTAAQQVARQLLPLAARDRRRATLRAKVGARIDSDEPAHIDAALAQEALAIGRANVSRAVSDLVRAGLVRRHYAGRVTDHANRGGRRMAVYAVAPPVLNAIRSRPTLV